MTHPDWVQLPRDVTISIFKKLDVVDVLFNVEIVCSSWRDICRDPSFWRSIRMVDSYSRRHLEINFYDDIIKLAVDRSCGGLEDIALSEYTDSDLFRYISNRSNRLHSLKLRLPDWDSSFVKEMKKFPLLTELELWFWPLTGEGLENLGRSCPLLTSLKLITWNSSWDSPSDRDAMAIAEQMQGLVHLGLVGNGLTNDGIRAVLDGCPRLRFLDLRQCVYVDLGGEFGKKCAERVEVLLRPEESTCDLGLQPLNYYDDSDDDYDYDFDDLGVEPLTSNDDDDEDDDYEKDYENDNDM